MAIDKAVMTSEVSISARRTSSSVKPAFPGVPLATWGFGAAAVDALIVTGLFKLWGRNYSIAMPSDVAESESIIHRVNENWAGRGDDGCSRITDTRIAVSP